MTHPADPELLKLAVEAVHRAGSLIIQRTAVRITEKGDRDLSSDADLAAEDEIRVFLAAETPEIPMLGEEGDGSRPLGERVWVVDPIDGTINYVHGMPLYAVSISLIENRRTRLAATYVPQLHATYSAVAGRGAHTNDQRIQASRVTSLREAVIAVDQLTFTGAAPAEANALRVALIQGLAPAVQRIRVHGSSAIDLAWTAHGRLDACVILANNPWDTSAGVLLAREAGAQVMDLEGRPHELTSRTTLAVAPGIADELHSAIDAVAPRLAFGTGDTIALRRL